MIALADAFAALGPRTRWPSSATGRCATASRAGIGVTVVGRIPQADVPRWVAAADVLCQPSLIEPFGQATLEGMAMERSVVATTVGGPPEFVPAAAGVLVEPGDVAALTAALERAAGAAVAESGRSRRRRKARRHARGGEDGRRSRTREPAASGRVSPAPPQ